MVVAIVSPSILTWVAIGCFTIAGTGNILSYHWCKKELEDLEKHQIFLKNQKKINECLSRGNEDVKDNTLNSVKNEEITPKLNVNDIHRMSPFKIKRMIKRIERTKEEVALDEAKNSALQLEGPKVLVKEKAYKK